MDDENDSNNEDESDNDDDGDIWSTWQLYSLLGVLVYTPGEFYWSEAASLYLIYPGAPNKT